MIVRIIGGIILIGLGGLVVIKAEWFYQNFGSVEFAERYLGTEGGTRLFYRLLGLTVIVLTFLWATGLLPNFLRKIFSPSI